MEGDAKLRKTVNRPVQIVLTDRGAGRAKNVEVIKVMHQEGDIIVSLLIHSTKSAILVKIYELT